MLAWLTLKGILCRCMYTMVCLGNQGTSRVLTQVKYFKGKTMIV